MNRYFIIPFVGLKIGKHHFEYEIDDTFFESMDYSLVHSGMLQAELELDKKETMLIANFAVSGYVDTSCDRCNAPMQLDIDGSYRLIYKFGLEEEEDEALIVLRPEAYEIDVTSPIYELIISLLPLRKTHLEDECDEEMQLLFQKHIVNVDEEEYDDEDEDWDEEDDWEDDEEPIKPIDPKWSALKNLN